MVLAASCEDYNRLAVITVHTRTRMYLQGDCYAKRNQNAIYICTYTCMYIYIYPVPSRKFAAFRIRPPGRKWRCSFNCEFPRSHKTAERSSGRFTGGRNCPLPREKVTDQPLRPTRSFLNLPSNDAREHWHSSLRTCVSIKYRAHADSNARPSSL